MNKVLFLILPIASILSATPLFDKCAICHGDKGEKHSKGLTRSIAGLKADEVITILTEYKSGDRNTYGLGSMMRGQTRNLSKDDIKELAKYVESLPPVETKNIKEEKKELTPKEIFYKCAICHGSKGEKKSLGVSKHIAGMKAEDVVKILKEYRSGDRNVYNYGNMMRGQATKLSEKEMQDVAEYIESLEPVKEEVEKKEPKKRITQEEVDYNRFMQEYFKNSKNPNETFEAAKKRYEEQKKLKDKNE